MTSPVFEMWTPYHPPVGFQKKGHNEAYFLIRCRRWHARQGNFGTMILTDRINSKVHVVHGKMPEVEAKMRDILTEHEGRHRA